MNDHTNPTRFAKADILVESLPYIQRYEGKTFVIKYGGAAMTDPKLKETFAKDVIMLTKVGINVIVVHGGGKEISTLSQKLGQEPQFVGGQRYTDDLVLRSALMSLAGSTNKDIVGLINRLGGNAVGLSGIDNNLLEAARFAPKGHDLGFVGEVKAVNVEFLNATIGTGVLPVIAPIGVGLDGQFYNINADVAASAVAAALGAEKLFYLSDTEGILVEGELLPTLTNTRAQQLIANGTISGGMIPKVTSAFTALAAGVKKVHIIDGGKKHSLLLEIFTNEGVGTQIIREEKFFANAKQNAAPNAQSSSKPYKQDFLDFSTTSKQDIEDLFELATKLKLNPSIQPLKGKTVTMVFEKPSLRTRVSFEIGIAQLGGTSVVLNNEGIGIGTREPASDIAKVLASYTDCIIARLFHHDVLLELAKNSSVPVVNALTDLLHPCQTLADLYTIWLNGKLRPGMKIAYIGDGNNVTNSWLEAAALFPMHLAIACPTGYEPDETLIAKAHASKISMIEILRDPRIAADEADILYTDVWTSMGQEGEAAARKAIFAPYSITNELVKLANPDALIMHCLPAHRGEEISSEVLSSRQSVVFEQAENRLHMQKALLATLLGGDVLPMLNEGTLRSASGKKAHAEEQSDKSSYEQAGKTIYN